MNEPPTDGIRVPVTSLCDLVSNIFQKVPVPEAHAHLMADLLVDTDLRGVVSHGVVQVERYVRDFQGGKINTHPNVAILREGPVTAALSGDGGLGFIVGARAMEMSIVKAKEYGVGIVTSTYHGHFGSCGKYIRMALREELIGMCCGGRNASSKYDYKQTLMGSIQGSPPMAFGMPSGPDQPAFLLDFASHMGWDEDCFQKMSAVFFKMLGISHVANILGGTLGGMMLPEFSREKTKYDARAGEGAFYMAVDIERFTSAQAFKEDMAHLMKEIRKMRPMPGYDESHLPGSREWEWEKDYRLNGVPISADAKRSLEQLAGEMGCSVPWDEVNL